MNEKGIKFLVLAGLALALIFTPVLMSQTRKMIQVKGSDTLVNLVQILAEQYMDKNPSVPLAVLGGGSSTGIAALLNGTCDIADASRDWKQKELDQAWEKGIKVKLFALAIDGLSIVVNEKNPVNELTMEQVAALYTGEVKKWKDIGGPDLKVSLYGRQSNSGTYAFLLEHVMKNKPYSTDMKEMNGNAQIIEGVLADEAGIGYTGVGYVVDKSTGKVMKGLKVVNISKAKGQAAYSPLNKEDVYNGNYPIARPLWQATDGTPKGDVKAFIEFELGPEGQKTVEAEGFFPIQGPLAQKNRENLK
jgi:phosphate transport system substrate-binding protein